MSSTNVLEKKKYACIFSSDIEKALKVESNASDHYLLAMPFNKRIHWFLAREIANNGKTATLEIIDKDVIKGSSVTRVINLLVNERGLLDNTDYSFYDVDRHDSELKIIQAIRKNSMGDYDFYHHVDNAFMITQRKSNVKF